MIFVFFGRLLVFGIFEVALELLFFLVWFPPYVGGFVLTPTTGRYAQSTQTMAVSVTHIFTLFFMTLGSRGGLAPPGAPFDEIAQIC